MEIKGICPYVCMYINEKIIQVEWVDLSGIFMPKVFCKTMWETARILPSVTCFTGLTLFSANTYTSGTHTPFKKMLFPPARPVRTPSCSLFSTFFAHTWQNRVPTYLCMHRQWSYKPYYISLYMWIAVLFSLQGAWHAHPTPTISHTAAHSFADFARSSELGPRWRRDGSPSLG